MGPKFNDGMFIRRSSKDTEIHREGSHVATEMEVEVMRVQLPEARRGLE